MLGAIFRWATGRRPAGDIEYEAREVSWLAAEFAAEAEANKVSTSGGNLDAATQPQRKTDVHRQS
jgi:hypothetical protein